jgi:hypothetical protein
MNATTRASLRYYASAVAAILCLLAIGPIGQSQTKQKADAAGQEAGDPAGDVQSSHDAGAFVPDAKQSGGEPDGIVQVANLVYAGTMSSRCFSDHFLIKAERESAISTSRRFHAVKLASQQIYEFPLLIMTGEGTFRLSDRERECLREYVQRGGLLLASAGCSSLEWDRSFRREMALIFSEQPLEPIEMSHPMFHTVYEIRSLRSAHGTPRPLMGIGVSGRLGVVYSQDGLNDTGHTQGCCCCGGNELVNAVDINVNLLAYALTY